MDPPSIVKNVEYNPSSTSQHAMFGVSQNPNLHYKSFSQNNSAIQDPTKRRLDDSEISIFDAHKYFNDNAELVVLNHRRNLDRPSHNTQSSPSVSSVEGYGGRHFRTRSFYATPTASSEASWNSQTGLLANPPGYGGVSMATVEMKKRNPCAAGKWIFGRKCCCTGKKSVQVEEAAMDSENLGPVIAAVNKNDDEEDGRNGKNDYRKDYSYRAKGAGDCNSGTSEILQKINQAQIKAPIPIRLSPENRFPAANAPRQLRVSASAGFSFPILNPNSQTNNSVIPPPEDPPRDSLEVFRPIDDVVPLSIDRIGSRSGCPIAGGDDDMCSDASSDLFEIESFSTQTTPFPPPYRRRDSLDEAPAAPFSARRFAEANGLNLNDNGGGNQFGRRSLDEPPTPSVAATECYAPSEVSIDWSVTTADGFDKASVSNFSASEIGAARMFRYRMQDDPIVGGGGGEGGKKKGNGGGGGLLLMSCRQEKAVSVGPQPVKCSPAEGSQNIPARGRSSKPTLGSSQSAAARLSLTFAA
ncbi:protein PHYTOCHROME KINASE SUBSTRATE 4-like [Andrographis paniculata]|uniref:protein PHYTOCHROME KINASE SUBSTRATE 4-like n=1 Tax=Andrographis paniculata TaxID=175694 RepID=UPI0021E89ED1|nr:protein PHYTOCHROME KINASE SUBSTRATE 4-like [Andrographis paniculata]